ncbi:PEP-CTERM sorting domain-containing protein [Roseisolibacter sp. H3M3-2]|uniref:PEP-CTERM sorting domain-containing protein n=1 Tax=Roseisolibacter sp. H3M3-2 TaxID=3031323 RepID=UPI0023DA2B4F|nr:PEP-CTERM sorting domain-containing protein [Roseisolibacter sp. H3M3-2]MDF1502957.1 PEP-CTERM sorting domain-containing protein [Roseisolibacter sp. H3M3-2]
MRLRTVAARAAVLTALAAAAAAPAAAQDRFIGQSFVAPAGPSTLLQTLTVGAGGLQYQNASAPMFAQIYAFNGSALVGASLFSQSLGTSFSGFTLSPSLQLAAGAQYAVVVGIMLTNQSIFTIGADVVPGGLVACTGVGVACETLAGDVVGFSTQYAPATTVPEPQTWALLGTGLLAVGGVARRRSARVDAT